MKYFYCRSRRTIKENYRETEKAVLDSILGKGYDKRIRPSGQNITGKTKRMLFIVFSNYPIQGIRVKHICELS